ncbi:3-isopropylmalate dehydratase large subunit, chloroplastic isoform B [Senna tora]|uniref:3-isopropylmalate dehydratase large subunit, chloroplastic isoform B n=1 Tax=Senna tora TaxID=362788 RepID=A0A834X2S9_9FABA|nr:3-isopropylmalate dehydratase large subunit, chloroplastic isoform B [Senna tora]
MEFVNKIVGTVTRALNNNTFINICLVASFATLGVRSANQQKVIEALEAEKENIVKSNKDMRKAMWDWKQQLFAEASTDSAVVPLARLKAIYGEAPTPQLPTADYAILTSLGDTVKQDGNSSRSSGFVV